MRMVRRQKPQKVIIRVPATTANLGPAFDCMGMALDLFNTLTVEPGRALEINVSGPGAEHLRGHVRPSDNLLHKSFSSVYASVGVPVPMVQMTYEIVFPVARGLGASAAAIVGGLVAANALLGNPMTPEELLQTASSIEGHPDNVAPALLGGCQLVIKDGERIVAAEVPLPEGLKAVLFIPDFELKTEEARRILPREIARADAIFNIGRAALLTTALATGRLEHLKLATQDRLHQPARRSLFPQMYDFFEAAMGAGALGAFLSGSGPTIMALAKNNERAIAGSMEKVARKAKIVGATLVTKPTKLGAHVIPLE